MSSIYRKSISSVLLILSVFWTLLAPCSVLADLELGVGTGSSTSARLVPALSGTLELGDYAVTGTSTGVRTTVYHLSSYTMGLVKRWNAGQFWWGQLIVGFGFGLAYSHYGLKDSPTGTEETQTDFTGGPLFQFRWMFLGPVYLGLDNLFGIRYFKGLVGLSAQDVILLSVGVKL